MFNRCFTLNLMFPIKSIQKPGPRNLFSELDKSLAHLDINFQTLMAKEKIGTLEPKHFHRNEAKKLFRKPKPEGLQGGLKAYLLDNELQFLDNLDLREDPADTNNFGSTPSYLSSIDYCSENELDEAQECKLQESILTLLPKRRMINNDTWEKKKWRPICLGRHEVSEEPPPSYIPAASNETLDPTPIPGPAGTANQENK